VIEVRGERVVLRAFRSHEIDRAVARMAGGSSIVLAGEAVQRERHRRLRIERSGTRNEWEVLFAIEADGRLIGDAQGRSSDIAMPPGVWEIGLELWDEAERGRGVGREAVALLSAHLFSEQGAIRVQATTDVDNAPMRGVLERVGFGFEGVLRGFMPSADAPPHDYAMYGLTKADWLGRPDG
jgi:RimJ/RimL family protein N-acetyltransferase